MNPNAASRSTALHDRSENNFAGDKRSKRLFHCHCGCGQQLSRERYLEHIDLAPEQIQESNS